jgi:hypothetical protein
VALLYHVCMEDGNTVLPILNCMLIKSKRLASLTLSFGHLVFLLTSYMLIRVFMFLIHHLKHLGSESTLPLIHRPPPYTCAYFIVMNVSPSGSS